MYIKNFDIIYIFNPSKEEKAKVDVQRSDPMKRLIGAAKLSQVANVNLKKSDPQE